MTYNLFLEGQNIQDILNKPFKIEQLSGSEKNQDFDSKFKNLQKNLTKYKIEEYRKNIFPYNSDLYLSYIISFKLLFRILLF